MRERRVRLVAVLLPLLPCRPRARAPAPVRKQWRCLLCPESGWSKDRWQARHDAEQHYLTDHYQRPDPKEEDK